MKQFPKLATFYCSQYFPDRKDFLICKERANGLRYLRVGGRGFCLGAGKSPKPEKCLKMPQNPTRQVHALLATVFVNRLLCNLQYAICATRNNKKYNCSDNQIRDFGICYKD